MVNFYQIYSSIINAKHSFSEYELKKIIFHIVRNNPNKREYYSLERNGFYQYGLFSGEYLLQVDERHESEYKNRDNYIVVIKGCGEYNYFGTSRFNELIKSF